jgi:hypothetical protein
MARTLPTCQTYTRAGRNIIAKRRGIRPPHSINSNSQPTGRVLHPPPPISYVDDWIHILRTHKDEEFTRLATHYEVESCPPCMDTSGIAILRPPLIQHYTHGGWQGTLKVQESLDGIFKLLHLDPSISMIKSLEAAQFLVLGESPTRWTRPRHFPDADNA